MSISVFAEKKKKREPIVVLTAHDYTFARLVSESGVDAILVGDSLSMGVLGFDSTLPVTLEDMIRHTQAVSRGAKDSLIIADMPFLSYQANADEALRNAGRFMKETGAGAVKLEGGESVAEKIRRIVSAGIPVMGHLGLTPQSIHQLGGYKVQGKTKASAEQLLNDAKFLEKAGCFSVVLECVPANVARDISHQLNIPTIGIGAGIDCDGQVLVLYDALGLTLDIHPKFVKQYANLADGALNGMKQFVKEVKDRAYPGVEHSF